MCQTTTAAVLIALLATACSDAAGPEVSTTAMAVAVGDDFSCALTADGRAWCWGNLLTGDTTLPIEVSSTLTFASITAGLDHACALTTAGSAWCWGGNDWGELGDGTRTGRIAPTLVSGAPTLASISAGYRHTCGLSADGTAWCWGSNELGQLGTGGPDSSLVPVAVNTTERFAALAAGGPMTCALRADGAPFCWGAADVYEIGQTGTETCQGTPCRKTPSPVDGTLRFRAIGAGGTHGCGVTTGGQVNCWGLNHRGQLGADSVGGTCFGYQCTPVPVPIKSTLTFGTVVPGNAGTCALSSDGAAWCWGEGAYAPGGASPFNSTPLAIPTGLRFTMVAASQVHACGRTSAGAVYCWGVGTYGQLGNGGRAMATIPVRAALPE
jgi:alpha-tubulin suppressor-like RCC1 family protein